MEFGHELFNEWTDQEWSRFDNYMMECISIYLDQGLIDMPLKNLDYRKLIDQIGQEMNIFFAGLDKNDYLNIKTTYDNLLDSFPELRKKNITQNLMTRNLKKYCQFHLCTFETAYSGGIGKMIIKEPNKPDTQPDVWDNITPIKETPF
jgi:hypothetical protein